MRSESATCNARKPRRGALRVTGGVLAGRRLRVPRDSLRPTSDRVRESLFARLSDLEGAEVLDLYAGTGALGIEALSRGAVRSTAVERSRRCLDVLRRNVSDLDLGERVRVVPGDAVRALQKLGREGVRFDLVLLDPPYASDESERALQALIEAAVLSAGGLVVLERGRRHPLPDVPGLAVVDERRYGDTIVTWLEGSRSNRSSLSGV